MCVCVCVCVYLLTTNCFISFELRHVIATFVVECLLLSIQYNTIHVPPLTTSNKACVKGNLTYMTASSTVDISACSFQIQLVGSIAGNLATFPLQAQQAERELQDVQLSAPHDT